MEDVKEDPKKEEITLFYRDNSKEQLYFMRLCSVCGAKIYYPWVSKNQKTMNARSCVCPGCRTKLETK